MKVFVFFYSVLMLSLGLAFGVLFLDIFACWHRQYSAIIGAEVSGYTLLFSLFISVGCLTLNHFCMKQWKEWQRWSNWGYNDASTSISQQITKSVKDIKRSISYGKSRKSKIERDRQEERDWWGME